MPHFWPPRETFTSRNSVSTSVRISLKRVFGHGFVYRKNEETGEVQKIGKSLGNVVEPLDIVTKFNVDAFRYYFLRECPFPGDGEFSWQRFADVYNADLANNLGNLYSRVVKLLSANHAGRLEGTAGVEPRAVPGTDVPATVRQVRAHVEACEYNQALERIWRQILDPANRHADKTEPWKLVKTDLAAAKRVLYDLVEQLRAVAILLKPFLPRTAATIYHSFNFPQAWDGVRHEDVWVHPRQAEDVRVLAPLEDGKVRPLFPRIS